MSNIGYRTVEQQREYMKNYYEKNKTRLHEYEKLKYKKKLYSTEEWTQQYYLYLKKHEMGLFKQNSIPRYGATRFDKGPKIKKMSKVNKTTTVTFN